MHALPSLHRLSRLSPPNTAALVFALLLALLLAGCGGGVGDQPSPQQQPLATRTEAGSVAASLLPRAEPPIAIFPGRGELREVVARRSFSVEEVAAAVAVPGTRVAGVTPRYAVQTWRVSYRTVDGADRPIIASGLMALPVKPAGAVSPVLSYQHGTIFKDAEAPSNALEPGEPPIVLASLGFIVLAPDYVGYGVSKGAQHPYLLSAPSAAAVNDLLTAGRLWRQTREHRGNGQLFLVGYSEGGYATAAAHRELTQSASPHREQLVAAFAGGGPQDVGTTLDRLLARVKDQNVLLGALINPGFLRHLGNTVREEVRRAMLRQIIPDDADVSFQSTFLDFFLADDVGNIERHCNVLDWKSEIPYRLFHGQDDRTVTVLSSQNAVARSVAAGTEPELVSVAYCEASPSDHLPCVNPFFRYTTTDLRWLARDL